MATHNINHKILLYYENKQTHGMKQKYSFQINW